MGIGPVQILLILLVILIIFGAGKLPKVMGDMGKGIKNFKKGLNEEDEKTGDPKTIDQKEEPEQEKEKEEKDKEKS